MTFITDNAYPQYLRPRKTSPAAPHVSGGLTSGLGGSGGMDTLNPQDHSPAPPGALDVTTKPDYTGLINGSPEVLTANANRDSANVNLTNLRSMIANQAVAQYGAVPDWRKLTSVTGSNWKIANDLDPTTTDLAAQNTAAGTSTIGQLQHAHQQNVANLRAELASRGILDSGQDALMESEEGRRYAGATDSATNDLFATLMKAQQDYLANLSPYDQSSTSAAGSAATRLAGSNQFDPVTTHAVQDKGFTAHGAAVYKDENGNYWNAGGQAVSKSDLQAAGASAPPPPHLPPAGGSVRPFVGA